MRDREGEPAVWASGTARAVVLLAILVTAGCTAAPSPPVTEPAVVETMVPSPSVSPPSVPEPTWVGPTPMASSTPIRVQIPAIGVDSELMELGLQADGTMEVPPGGFPAGWYTGAPTPGELGPAVIAGHVD